MRIGTEAEEEYDEPGAVGIHSRKSNKRRRKDEQESKGTEN